MMVDQSVAMKADLWVAMMVEMRAVKMAAY